MTRRFPLLTLAGLLALGACAEEANDPAGPSTPSLAESNTAVRGINVVLKSRPTASQLDRLNSIGRVKAVFKEINGLTMAAKGTQLKTIKALPFVKAAAFDAVIHIPPPTDLVPVADFTGGFSTWDQDAIDVTRAPLSSVREVSQTGQGVYVGVLDTGLLYTWRQYFPQERIASQFARTFVGGGSADRGRVVELDGDQWQRDGCSHGTHVTSTILGFQAGALRIQGTAPRANIIPVRLHTQGSVNSQNFCPFFSSVAAAALLYFAELKRGPLAGEPLVVNNSWGGPPDPLTRAAVDFALAQGVLLVFSAGNAGTAGMGFPGSYAPVISAAASGWVGEWRPCAPAGPGADLFNWWLVCNVPEPTDPDDFYITDFSSRELTGQDLDVAAPGSWVLGPFQLQRANPSFFFLGGTSMAAPHVTGTVALMLQKEPSLTQAQAETILQNTAIGIGAGCRDVIPLPGLPETEICWTANATGEGLLDADAAVAATP
jgi:subtilisin family serine protease